MKFFKQISLILVSCLILTGCPLDGGDGKTGVDGINCWDTNSNGINDPEEDINGDGAWDTKDCLAQTQTTQNPDVTLNHQHICEALANLGQYPDGCPSAGHNNPPGTLTRIFAMIDDGTGQAAVSCNFAPNNGILSLEQINGLYYWSLEGGFIASSTVIPFVDELTDATSCMSLCQADPECIASYAKSKSLKPNVIVYACNIFHHSDTIQPFEEFCGPDLAGCGNNPGVLQSGQRWSAICP